jgi:hypothetical protein
MRANATLFLSLSLSRTTPHAEMVLPMSAAQIFQAKSCREVVSYVEKLLLNLPHAQ